MATLRDSGYRKEFFIYFLAVDAEETHDRIMRVMGADTGTVAPFVMPYRNLDGNCQIVSDETKRLARWCNKAWIRKSCTFENYKPKTKSGI